MKKLLTFILAALMLFTTFSLFAFNVNADFPNSEEAMNGYENLCLAYTYNRNGASHLGRHTPEDFKPYVAYYDTDGNIKDFFFDSYLFLPCVTKGPSGARIHYDATNPTKAIDWVDYVNDTFNEGTNVDALEVAFGEAKQKLGDSERKAGVVFSILYPAYGQKDFGELGGKTLDFSKLEDRKYAIKWIIDEQIKLYNEGNYQHLDLFGFYWLEEYLVPNGNKQENRQLYIYASEYLHSLGLKFIWIPWYRAEGYKEWKQLGFDISCMQPNMYWQAVPTANRVEDTVSECKLYGMGTEIEIDGKALVGPEYYNRYLDYLEGGMNKGAMGTVKMYYQDAKSGVYYQAWKSKDPRARSVYDLTYKYAKGTLTQEDIDNNRSPEFELPKGVDWRSKEMPYTATTPYSDGNSIGYQKNNGKELTDGIIGASELDTEWHAFHKSLLDPDGRMSVTVDLGKVYDDLTHFMAHFSHVQEYGIGDPADIKILISEDGENFKQIAAPELQLNDIFGYVSYKTKPVSARYVKFSFINSTQNFVFCSEVLVGAGKAEENVNSGSVADSTPEDSSDNSVGDTQDKNGVIWAVAIGAVVLVAAVCLIFVLKRNKKQ